MLQFTQKNNQSKILDYRLLIKKLNKRNALRNYLSILNELKDGKRKKTIFLPFHNKSYEEKKAIAQRKIRKKIYRKRRYLKLRRKIYKLNFLKIILERTAKNIIRFAQNRKRKRRRNRRLPMNHFYFRRNQFLLYHSLFRRVMRYIGPFKKITSKKLRINGFKIKFYNLLHIL